MELDRLRARACKKCGAPQSAVGTCGDRWHIPNRSNPQQARRWELPEERKAFLMEVRQYMADDLDDFVENVVQTPEDEPVKPLAEDTSITQIFQDSQD